MHVCEEGQLSPCCATRHLIRISHVNGHKCSRSVVVDTSHNSIRLRQLNVTRRRTIPRSAKTPLLHALDIVLSVQISLYFTRSWEVAFGGIAGHATVPGRRATGVRTTSSPWACGALLGGRGPFPWCHRCRRAGPRAPREPRDPAAQPARIPPDRRVEIQARQR